MARKMIGIRHVTIDNVELPVEIFSSSKARRIRITSRTGTDFRLTVPPRTSSRTISSYIDSFKPWMTRLYRQRKQFDAGDNVPQLKHGGTVNVMGTPLRINVHVDKDGFFSIRRRDDNLEVRVPENRKSHVPNLVLLWLRHQAEQEIPLRLLTLATRMNQSLNRLKIKDQRSKWGSCSSRRNINLNWRIILLPPEIFNYILVHELTHLSIQGHGPAFWQAVSRYCPDHKRYRKWLRENQWLLHFGRDLLHCALPPLS